MPEVVTLTALTLGEMVGGTNRRREIPSGARIELTDEQYAELSQHDPPVIADPRSFEGRQNYSTEIVSQVADAADPLAENPRSTGARASAQSTTTTRRKDEKAPL